MTFIGTAVGDGVADWRPAMRLLACTSVIGIGLATAAPALAQTRCSMVCYGELANTPNGISPEMVAKAEADTARILETKGKEPFERITKLSDASERVTEAADWFHRGADGINAIAGFSETWGAPVNAALTVAGWAVDAYVAKQTEAYGQLVDQGLAEINAADSARIAQLRAMGDPAAMHAEFFGPDGQSGLFAGTTAGQIASPASRAAIAALGVDMLNRRLGTVSGVVVQQGEQIKALGEHLNNLTTSYVQFREVTRKHIADLKTEQQNMQQAIGRVAAQTVGNTRRLDTVERLLYDRMSAPERLALVRRAGLPGVSLNAAELQQLEREAAVTLTRDYAQRIGAAAGDIAAIGSVAGIDLSKEAAFVQTAANTVFNVAQVMSGEPFAVISGLGGIARMFGGGGAGGSADAAVAKEVRALRKEMFQYHKQTMETLAAISTQIDDGFRRLLENQDHQFRETLFIAAAVDEVLIQDLKQCVIAADLWVPLDPGESHDQRAARFTDDGVAQLRRCRNGIDNVPKIDNNQASVSTALWAHALRPSDAAGNAPATDEDVQTFNRWRDGIYRPTLNYTRARSMRAVETGASCTADRILLTALTASDPWMGGANAMLIETARRCYENPSALFRAYASGAVSYSLDAYRVLAEPLDATRIVALGAKMIAATAIYEFLRDGGNSVATHAQMMVSEAPSVALSQRHLGYAADIASIGIAQSTLIGGDLVIDAMIADIEAALAKEGGTDLAGVPAGLWSGCNAPPNLTNADYFNALCVLYRNPVLRSNFIRRWVHSRRTGTGFTGYSAGLAYDRPDLIQSALKPGMPVAACAAGATQRWCLSLPRSGITAAGIPAAPWLLELPAWGDAASERLAFGSPERADLIALRGEARRRIQAYRLSATLPAEELTLLKAGLISNVAARTAEQTDPPTP